MMVVLRNNLGHTNAHNYLAKEGGAKQSEKIWPYFDVAFANITSHSNKIQYSPNDLAFISVFQTKIICITISTSLIAANV